MPEVNIPEVLEEIKKEFLRYEIALTTNDLVELDKLFWNSNLTVRYGVSENLLGYDAIQKFRLQRPSVGLMRALRNTVITTFGRDMATACTEFSRSTTACIGRQSQTWVRTGEGWKIVAAHISLMDPAK